MCKSRHFLAVTLAISGFLAANTFLAGSADAAQRFALQTGADLAQVCSHPANAEAITDEERQRLGVCGAYIQGFLGHYALVRRDIGKQTFCLPPEGVSAENVRQLFLALLEQRPQIRDLPANLDLVTSLAWGYSCK
ncbi:Rap1a/Tai family immunity protein [Parvibaculum sp.]|uniref:Rap1a/Tai family immunity protein n=1 Tax=Parvibaculum sp. TaxID=2024848 RepID=UPI0034A0567A